MRDLTADRPVADVEVGGNLNGEEGERCTKSMKSFPKFLFFHGMMKMDEFKMLAVNF